ncbi:MAG: transglutaminase domain-containing protein [Lachnospiraceae bacterium]|nr:transglutaminase domain-containing protein [Lachnospiraceae bacterium]
MKKNKEFSFKINDDTIKSNVSKEYIDVPYYVLVIATVFLINAGFISTVKVAYDLEIAPSIHICAIFCCATIVTLTNIFVHKDWLRKIIKISLAVLPLILMFRIIVTGLYDCINNILFSLDTGLVVDLSFVTEYFKFSEKYDAQDYFWLYVMLVTTLIMTSKMLATQVPYFIMHLQFAIIVVSIVIGIDISFLGTMVYAAVSIAFLIIRSRLIMKETTGYVIVAIIAGIIIASSLVSRAIVGKEHEKPAFVIVLQEKIYDLNLGKLYSSLVGEKRGQLNPDGPKQTGEVLFLVQMEKISEPLYLKSYVGNRYTSTGWTDTEYLYTKSDYKSMREKLVSTDFKPHTMQSEFYRLIKKKDDYIYATGFTSIKAFSNSYGEGSMNVYKLNDSVDYIIYPYDAHLDNFSFNTDMQPYAPDITEYTIKRTYINKKSFGTVSAYLEAVEALRQLGDSSTYEQYFGPEKSYRRFVYDEYTTMPKGVLEDVQKACKGYDFDSYEEIAEFTDKLQAYFTENYFYSLKPGSAPKGKNELEYFLYENKRGYCVYFATAATLIYRAAGVPARYVEGYLVLPEDIGEYAISYSQEMSINGEQNYYNYNLYNVEITDYMAHAWVEIYIDGYGWLPIEVTPSAYERPNIEKPTQEPTTQPVTEEPTTEEPTTQEPTTKEEETSSNEEATTKEEETSSNEEPTSKEQVTEPTSEEPSTQEQITTQASELLGEDGDDGDSVGNAVKKSRLQIYVILLMLLIVSALLIIFIRHGYYSYKRLRMLKAEITNADKKKIIDMYEYLEELLAYIELAKEKDMSYKVYARHLKEHCSYTNVVDFKAMIDLAVYAKFSESAQIDVKAAEMFRDNLLKLRAAIYEDLKWYRKVSFTFINNL